MTTAPADEHMKPMEMLLWEVRPPTTDVYVKVIIDVSCGI